MNSSTSSSKRFVTAFLCTALILACGLAGTTEWIIRTKVVPHHNDYAYAELFRQRPSPNAMFGDSHIAYGLTGLPGFVNMAHGGDNFANIAGKMHFYYEGLRPSRVILQAGVHHFSRNFIGERFDETPAFRALVNGYSPWEPRIFKPMHQREMGNYWSELIKGGQFAPLQDFQPDGSRLGRASLADEPATVRRVKSEWTARTLQPVANFETLPIAQAYARELDWLLAQGAQPCLVTMPMAPDLRAQAAQMPAYQQTEAFFSELARSRSVSYVNLLFADIDDDRFSDPHHLNATGAREVSPLVYQRCFGG